MKYRFFSNVAIALFLFLHLVAIVPRQNLAHERLRGFLDPIYDKAGWVQKPWDLFAPNPTRMNVRVLAVIAYEDGEVQTWVSPDPLQQGPWEKFRDSKLVEFITNVRLNNARDVWPSVARYFAREYGRADASVIRVQLIREWDTIAIPESDEDRRLPYQPEYDSSFVFYSEEFPP